MEPSSIERACETVRQFLALGHDLTSACEHGLAFAHDALLHGHRLADAVTLAGIEYAQANIAHLHRLSGPP